MPVTKKKGAIFGIYTDSPARTDRPAHPPTRSSPRIAANSTRRALSSLQPKSIAPAHNQLSAKSNAELKTRLGGKPLSDAPLSRPKPKSKSTLEIYADPESSRPKPSLGVSGAASVTSVTKRKAAPAPLAASQSLPLSLVGSSISTKRSRDLLSPLPIFSDQQENEGTSQRPTARSAETGQSPTKRGRVALSAVGSSPAAIPRKKTAQTTDKENAPPSVRLKGNIEGSPATRTRSKTRNTPFELSMTLSPLTFRDTPQRCRTEIQRLLGDQMTVGGTGQRQQTIEQMINQGSPRAEKTGTGKPMTKKNGKGMSVTPDGALVDVSEAYGARGDAPTGFSSQGHP